MPELDQKFCLMLSLQEGIGPVKYKAIIDRYTNHRKFAENADHEYLNESGIGDKQISAIINFEHWDKIDSLMDKAKAFGIAIICLGEESYPETLTQIYSPPTMLFLKGELGQLGKPAVAVVGSRTPTSYGREMARKIAGGLAERGLMIISGLAWGIDSEAHQAALDAGGKTAAIFGCGIDIIYPSQHRDLAGKIETGGFLLSEFPFGTRPDKFNFPRRNRIISGLAQAVVIVEAAEKSGALVTADLAAEQGKDVFAVPGQADNPKSRGALSLLKQGASLATGPEDILEALGWETTSKSEKKNLIKLEPDEQKLCDVVGIGPAHVDELTRKLGFPPARLSAIILKLELAGLVVRRPGNYVARG